MFKKSELPRIWKIINNTNSGMLKDNCPVGWSETKTRVLNFEEIIEKAVKKLEDENFSVERVNPKKANCIIRVFRHESIKCEDDIWWVYGADAFLKTFNGMRASYGAAISYKRYGIRNWIFQDECLDMEPHFVDYYFKIKGKVEHNEKEMSF